MSRRSSRRALGTVALVGLALAACGRGPDDPVVAGTLVTSTTTGVTSTTVLTTTTSAIVPSPPATSSSTVSTVPPLPIVDPTVRVGPPQAWVPYADAGGVVLHHPSATVERIGFHESAHDGAVVQQPTSAAVRPVLLESRDRGTSSQTAADIVVQPDTAIRAPITGTVKRSGGYTLYCDTPDEYVVIEPDARPGWEVKVLHMNGVRVRPGDRVTAGRTELAARAHVLPFASQVDELRTYDPAWPHVHVEVVDPSVPDRPTPGAGC